MRASGGLCPVGASKALLPLPRGGRSNCIRPWFICLAVPAERRPRRKLIVTHHVPSRPITSHHAPSHLAPIMGHLLSMATHRRAKGQRPTEWWRERLLPFGLNTVSQSRSHSPVCTHSLRLRREADSKINGDTRPRPLSTTPITAHGGHPSCTDSSRGTKPVS